MSINPGGPIMTSLTQFVENSITGMYTATTEGSFMSEFDAFLAKDAQITVNGRRATVAQYREELNRQRSAGQSPQVSFLGGVQVMNNAKDQQMQQQQAGAVGVFYTVAIDEGKPFGRTITSSMNVTLVNAGTGSGVPLHKASTVDQVILNPPPGRIE